MSVNDDYDDHEDETLPDAEELDPEALKEAEAAGAAVGDDPDIDTKPVPGGSQAADVPGPPPALPTVDDVISGRVPVLLVHKSHQLWQRIPQALGVARRVTGGRIGTGAVARLPRMSPDSARDFLRSCTHASLRVADPEVFALPQTGSPAKPIPSTSTRHYPWATGIPDPQAPEADKERWAQEVVYAQILAGANVLLSPTGWVTDQNAVRALREAMSWVVRTRRVLGPEVDFFVNLTLAGGWLTNPQLRQVLLNEIVESTERLWYIRVRWPIVDPRYGQLIDPGMLDGYKDLAATARLEEKILLLPNSGLTGWLATALGATGFSTGTSWPEQAFAEERKMGSTPGRPKPPAIQRYFERSVLHPLPWDDAQALSQVADHVACQCRYCRSLRADGYEKSLASSHYLVRVARLVDELGNVDRRTEALRIVRAARAFVTALPATHALTGAWLPGHLAPWEARLL